MRRDYYYLPSGPQSRWRIAKSEYCTANEEVVNKLWRRWDVEGVWGTVETQLFLFAPHAMSYAPYTPPTPTRRNCFVASASAV